MAHLAISLLGQFEVTLDGQPVTCFGTDKTRALLAYLVTEADRTHRRSMLAGLLWPDVPEAAARHNLSQALLLLRQALGDKSPSLRAEPPFLLATRQTLRFNPDSDHTFDVATFQAQVSRCVDYPPDQLEPADAQGLAQALDCYRGQFLSTPLRVDSLAFEEWQLLKQTQLHLLALDGLDYLGQYYELRGEFGLVADYARRQIELDPLREMAHRRLMNALMRDNRRPEALAHYATFRALLADELGIAPASETRALYEQILVPQDGAVGERSQRSGEKPRRETWETGPLGPPPPFVGRVRELARLNESLASMMAGQGQVVFVTGAAGSGKTALLVAFAQRALAEHADLLVVNGSGNAYTGLGDPYWPFIEMLRQLHGTAVGSSMLSRRQAQRLETTRSVIAPLLATCSPDLERLLAGASPIGGGEAVAGRANLEQSGLFDQITRAMQTVAKQHPLVLLLDDMQWADQASLNLLFHLGRRLGGQRLLIVGAFRPDVFHQGYAPSDYLHEQHEEQSHPLAAIIYELQRRQGNIQIDLAQTAGRDFIAALMDSEPNHLNAEFWETLYEHTGGNALFTTELLRGMQERGDLVRDAQGYWVEGDWIAWDTLPARVEGVIAALIGQLLPEWQSLLTVASVEGAEFTAQVLAHVQGIPEDEVSRRLSGALSRHYHLVVPVGVQLGGTSTGLTRLACYRFRHLLFQKYLYDRLDPVEQAQLHLAVGHALEMLYAERAVQLSLPLARHFELGGDLDKAVVYLLQAGRRAAHLAATEEALRLLTRGLALLKRLDKSPARQQQEVELQLALGTALRARGWNTLERAQAFERAYELGQRAGDPDQVARTLVMLADIALGRGQLDRLTDIGERLLALAENTRAPAQISRFGHYALGVAHFFRGHLSEARPHLEQVAAASDIDIDTLARLIEADTYMNNQVWLVYTLWALGYVDQAAMCSEQTIAVARDLGYAFSLWFALSVGELSVRHLRREPQAMRAALDQLASLDRDAGPGLFRPWVIIFDSWLAAVDDHDPDGLARLRQALQAWESIGAQGGRAQHRLLLAEAYLALGQTESALATLDQLLDQISATGIRFFEPEVLRLKGEALRTLGRPDEAEVCFLNAIVVAQEQTAKTWELRVATSLCRLYQAQGRPAKFEQAREQLADVYAWFSEGFDTADLREAALFAEPRETCQVLNT